MDNRFTKIIQITIILTFLAFFSLGVYNFILNRLLIDTAFVNEASITEGYDTKAFFYRDEYLVDIGSQNVFETLVKEGQRVNKNYLLGKINDKSIISNQAGIVSFKIDGLEGIKEPLEYTNLKIEDIEAKYLEKNLDVNNDTSDENNYIKIINNLQGEKVFIRIPLDLFDKPLNQNDYFNIYIEKIKKSFNTKIINLKGVSNEALLELELAENIMSKYDLRLENIRIVLKENSGTLIPIEALTKNEEGIEGVYVVNKNFVNFKETDILARDEENVLVSNIKPMSKIITSPNYVKEGKYLN